MESGTPNTAALQRQAPRPYWAEHPLGGGTCVVCGSAIQKYPNASAVRARIVGVSERWSSGNGCGPWRERRPDGRWEPHGPQ